MGPKHGSASGAATSCAPCATPRGAGRPRGGGARRFQHVIHASSLAHHFVQRFSLRGRTGVHILQLGVVEWLQIYLAS